MESAAGPTVGPTAKICVKCNLERPITKFKTNGNRPDGTRSRMATCSYCTASAKAEDQRSIVPGDSISNVSNSSVRSKTSSSGLSDTAIKQINDSFQKMMETISKR